MLLPSNGAGGWNYVYVRVGGSVVHTVHSLRLLIESYGTSIPRQGVMQQGGVRRVDDRSLSLTGLTYIPLLNRKRERVIGRYTFAVRSALVLQ